MLFKIPMKLASRKKRKHCKGNLELYLYEEESLIELQSVIKTAVGFSVA
jgi:hypothetical protein